MLCYVMLCYVMQPTSDVAAYQILGVASTSTVGAKIKATCYSETSAGIYSNTNIS